ncbi:hypothetical protein BC939DRAFT_201733 [Gamsiella multidivaricata]|uniref:uncharacterized protein n=1 Tax=Gamsiella multidivaricata TaxID=101098 RepID=UPI00222074E1|nr:uncharacterized protein BC939DRAFT_201733 [Gamsiella multidivaricata]KAI7821695.1 hypothetical protein BC939DRAFT_201733 [Gamsiella multidivaricata]
MVKSFALGGLILLFSFLLLLLLLSLLLLFISSLLSLSLIPFFLFDSLSIARFSSLLSYTSHSSLPQQLLSFSAISHPSLFLSFSPKQTTELNRLTGCSTEEAAAPTVRKHRRTTESLTLH